MITSGLSIWGALIMLLVLLPLYFLPTILALSRNHPHKVPIILINIFGGILGGIGWVAALVWCFITPDQLERKSPISVSELEKLHKLKEAGALTQEEFEHQKVKLLNA